MTEPINPYAPPQASLQDAPWRGEEGGGPLRPLPFEDLEAIPGFWARVGAMFSLAIRRPMEGVDRVPVTDSLTAAWRFNLLMTLPYLVVTGLFMLLMIVVIGRAWAQDPKMPKALFVGILGGELLLIALFMSVAMFIQGVVVHACLWLWGGLRDGRGLRQTLRTIGYGNGFNNLVMAVPLLGPLAALVGWVFLAIGLARLHRTDTWRGVCAVFTPVALCCGVYLLFFVLVIGASAMGH